MILYKNCRLQKMKMGRIVEQTRWIPESYCVLDQTVNLRDKQGLNEEWRIVGVNHTRQTENYVELQPQNPPTVVQ